MKLKIPYTQNVGKKLNIPAEWWTKGVAVKNEGGCFESPTGPKITDQEATHPQPGSRPNPGHNSI